MKEFVTNLDNDPHLYDLEWKLSFILTGEGSKLPGWAGLNSLLSNDIPVTRICPLPLIPAPAHEWTTLLTVNKPSILL